MGLKNDQIRVGKESKLVDVVVGPMSKSEVSREINALIDLRDPSYIAVIMRKNKGTNKYHTKMYITSHDFTKYINWGGHNYAR